MVKAMIDILIFILLLILVVMALFFLAIMIISFVNGFIKKAKEKE